MTSSRKNSKPKRKKSIYLPRYEEIIDNLRKAREESGLRQEYVNEKLGKYASYLSKIEHGDRRIDIIELIELAELYNVDLNDIVGSRLKKRRK